MNSAPRGPLVSHIGIAVRDLEAAIKQFAAITGIENPIVEEVSDQQVRVAMFSAGDNPDDDSLPTRIELVAPTSDESPVARSIERRGEGLHHICLYVDDIEAKLRQLKEAGARLIDEVPRTGAGGCRIAFVHPSSASGVLIELQERRR